MWKRFKWWWNKTVMSSDAGERRMRASYCSSYCSHTATNVSSRWTSTNNHTQRQRSVWKNGLEGEWTLLYTQTQRNSPKKIQWKRLCATIYRDKRSLACRTLNYWSHIDLQPAPGPVFSLYLQIIHTGSIHIDRKPTWWCSQANL